MVVPPEIYTECDQRLVQYADVSQNILQRNGALRKQCSKCHLWLSFDRFYVYRRHRDGLNPWCKSCTSTYQKKVNTPEVTRSQKLRYKYGITPQQYDRMLADQNGVCAVCRQPETKRHRKDGEICSLSVDHDHTTGEVRALLCDCCNTVLGKFNEDPERIRALADYAEWCRNRESSLKTVQLQLLG